MKLTCSIVEDLLPLYLENMCSEDTNAALEEHLRQCPACQEKLERMKSGTPRMDPRKADLPVSHYAKKVRRHRICVGISVTLICLLAVCALSILGLTVLDMHKAANPTSFEVEDGVYNLTSGYLESTAEEIGQYVFYTNSTKIEVTVTGSGNFQGTVMLWDTQYPDKFIQIGQINEKANVCTFTCGSAARRYRITCDGLAGATLSVSDGRTVSFWNSLLNVLEELLGG